MEGCRVGQCRMIGNCISTYLVDREPDTEILDTHLPLLATILLHDGHKAGALSVSIIILLQINNELGILHKGWVVTTPPSCTHIGQPATIFDHRIPGLCCV